MTGAGRHTTYKAGESSRCPAHSWCAYLGTEENRCPVCHLSYEKITTCSCDRCRNSVDAHHEQQAASTAKAKEKAVARKGGTDV